MELTIVIPERFGVSLPETAKIIGVSRATVSRLREKFLFEFI
jgi:DNA-directed RNA polymerase specialized sigma subunit